MNRRGLIAVCLVVACGPSVGSSAGEADDEQVDAAGGDADGCPSNLHGDDSSCGNGRTDPGEFCGELVSIARPNNAAVADDGIAGHRDQLLVGDFNGDGQLDLLVGVQILLGNGDGTFGEPLVQASSLARQVAVGDFNGDGISDLAFPNAEYDLEQFEGGLHEVVVRHGSPDLGPKDGLDVAVYAVGLSSVVPVTLAAVDLDADGFTDLVFGEERYDLYDCRSGWMRNLGGSGFAEPKRFDGPRTDGTRCSRFWPIDWDRDRVQGVAMRDSVLTFQPSPVWTLQEVELIAGSFGADLDCDGLPDGFGAGRYLKGVPEAPGYQAEPLDVDGASGAAVVDLNADGAPDVVLGTLTGLEILFGGGDTFPAERVTRATDRPVQAVVAGDFNEDATGDIVAMSSESLWLVMSGS